MALRRSTGLLNKLGGISTNLLSNGAFASTGSWTADSATISADAGVLTITTTSTTVPGTVYQNITTVPGRVYKVSVTARAGAGANYMISAGEATGGTEGNRDLVTRLQDNTTAAEKVFSFVAAGTSTRITFTVSNGTSAGLTTMLSNAAVEEVLDGFREIMRGCRIAVYTGSQPSSANDAKQGNLLYTITKDGAGVEGLSWGPASNGVISKTSAEGWKGTADQMGTAGWFRCYENGDNPAISSATAARFDGAISTSGGEITMANTYVEAGSVQSITAFSYTQPQ